MWRLIEGRVGQAGRSEGADAFALMLSSEFWCLVV